MQQKTTTTSMTFFWGKNRSSSFGVGVLAFDAGGVSVAHLPHQLRRHQRRRRRPLPNPNVWRSDRRCLLGHAGHHVLQ
ncbi:hypothetical protein U1Q18_033415 [Sarracenia purpurea var. burkii]